MKLWLLSVRENCHSRFWHDCSHGHVVRAKSARMARKIASEHAGDEAEVAYNPWLDPEITSCEQLKEEGEEGLILRDFLAG